MLTSVAAKLLALMLRGGHVASGLAYFCCQ